MMNVILVDFKGVLMKVMLEGFEKKIGFINVDELLYYDECI